MSYSLVDYLHEEIFIFVLFEGVNIPLPWSQPNYNQGTENYAVLHMRNWIVYNVAMDTTGYPVICETGTFVSIFRLIFSFDPKFV